jgi:hypothetical protein
MFGKKFKPEELRAKLNISSSRLEAYEKRLVSKEREARDTAKTALQSGDERQFKAMSRRVALVQGQRRAISGMVDMASGMRDVVEMQQGVATIVDLGRDLKQYEKHLGIDHTKLEQAMAQVTMSMEKVNAATGALTETMETIATGQDLTEAEKALRKELLAEIQGDGARSTELERRIEEAHTNGA